MSEASIKPDCGDPTGRTAAEMAGCCGPDTAKMTQECSCASAMKGRWKTALFVFSLIFLAFLISQVGGVLGMIAFFRTF